MPAARIVRAHGSHLYPGAQVTLEGRVPEMAAPCLVEFADGAVAAGSLAPGDAAGAILETAPYRTAAGTAIPEKRWLLAPGPADEWRVVRRVETLQWL